MGNDRRTFELGEGATISDAMGVLRDLREWSRVDSLPLTYAVNEEVVTEDRPLRHGDRLALLPPVSGG
jgi:molybdopterin converting factor small subunit